MYKVSILILFLSFYGFSFAQNSRKMTFIKDKAQTAWIFGESEISILNKKEFKELEKLIRAKVVDYNKNVIRQNRIKPHNYFRQYVVVENAKGEKEVWVNFLCEVDDKTKWKTEIIMASDGGECYLNISINLTLQRVDHFVVNGYA